MNLAPRWFTLSPAVVKPVVMWLASRPAIDRGLAEGSPERADEVLVQAEA